MASLIVIPADEVELLVVVVTMLVGVSLVLRVLVELEVLVVLEEVEVVTGGVTTVVVLDLLEPIIPTATPAMATITTTATTAMIILEFITEV